VTAPEPLELVVVTGMSGAGRSTALRVLADLGYFCVDNIPPALVSQLLDLIGDEPPRRVALGVDVRTGRFLEGAGDVIDQLGARGAAVEVLFLEAQDEELVRRFSETRRAHPLVAGGNLLDAIQRERERLAPLRVRAQRIIDTTAFNVHDLRRALVDLLAHGRSSMVTRILSFGFKYGVPVDADLVFDLRHLPNPHFVPELRPRTGVEADVAAFVMDTDQARELLDDVASMLGKLLPAYAREGKSYLTIAVGCTGGRHRSVAFAEALATRLGADKRALRVEHRDMAHGGT
jgi:UPF0042 nucleotide-binding protein